MKLTSLQLFSKLKRLDGSPLLPRIEPYRRDIFVKMLDSDRYSIGLFGRGKKNNKSLDLDLAALYVLTCHDSPQGSTCFIVANDEGQAADDLDLCKKLIAVNPLLSRHLVVGKKVIERRDGRGVLQVLPARDVAGSHGKSYAFLGYDELHGHRDWSLLEALQPDPHRTGVVQWVTSYASLFNRVGAPLHDLMQIGKSASDPRMLSSWYAGDYCTDPEWDAQATSPEIRANPSYASWPQGLDYLTQQQGRTPSYLYRHIHLNLEGLPPGSAFQLEMVEEAVPRGVRVRPYSQALHGQYVAFVDMSGGSQDDAPLAIAHLDAEGQAVLDYIGHQGAHPPFDPLAAVGKHAATLKEYRVSHVAMDRYAGLTFQSAFSTYGISSEISLSSASELYSAFEARLNSRQVILLDHPILEQQLLGLVWRGGKIDHPAGEHDDWANAACGALLLALDAPVGEDPGEAADDLDGAIPADEIAGNFLEHW